MADSDVTVAQNGRLPPVKLHPHLIALLRWCVSFIWSAASELLNRIMAASLPPITNGVKRTNPFPVPQSRRWSIPRRTPQRQATSEHINPVPKVECAVLHEPEDERALDIIFVHGLYGSLENTWRQGDWRQKYKCGLNKVPLKRSSAIPTACKICEAKFSSPAIQINMTNYDFCVCDYHAEHCDGGRCHLVVEDEKGDACNRQLRTMADDGGDLIELNDKSSPDDDDDVVICDDDDDVQGIVEGDGFFVTDNIFGETFLETVEVVDNYEAHAKFVRDLFQNETGCDRTLNDKYYTSAKAEDTCSVTKEESNLLENYNFSNNIKKELRFSSKGNYFDNDRNYKIEEKPYRCKPCHYRSEEQDCSCDLCTYQTARGRRNCQVGCGCVCERCYSPCWPRDWLRVDHPEARIISINYTSDPYLWRPVWVKESKRLHLQERAEQMMRQLIELGVGEKPIVWVGHSKGGLFIKQIFVEAFEAREKSKGRTEDSNNNDVDARVLDETQKTSVNSTKLNNAEYTREEARRRALSNNIEKDINVDINYKESCIVNEDHFTSIVETVEYELGNTFNRNEDDHLLENLRYVFIEEDQETDKQGRKQEFEEDEHVGLGTADSFVNDDVDGEKRASLWSNSVGFMFYSVPHRGSSLADINVAPLMLRSIELLEITKDCSLVLDLHERWLRATEASKPLVRSLVETCRTLMGLLWLRIVSVESADAGIGALCGVSLDHREICKPSSRSCLLYTELLNLIHAALDRCRYK